MFNSSKTADIKGNAEKLLDSVRENVVDIAQEAGMAANRLGNRLQGKSAASKAEAVTLLESVKNFFGPKAAAATADEITGQLAEQILDWRAAIQQELGQVVQSSKISSRKVLKTYPLLTLTAILAAGILIGYLASSSRAEEKEVQDPALLEK